MKFGNLKYKSLLFGTGAALLMTTSCKDFLDVDIYDNYSAATLNSKAAYESLTTTLYGGNKWFQYESKFSWCVNEGIPGVLFNVNDQEGALFRLTIGEDNTILKEGYTSLYSGVIAHANSVIKTCNKAISEGTIPGGMTKEDMEAVIGEARLFRAYAHFLATEYFGETPLVFDTENDIADAKTLPLASRRAVYKACENDLKYAIDKLPESNQTATWRATKYSAKALLAKLYLTMASCRANNSAGLKYPYVCPNPDECLTNAEQLLNEVIKSGKYWLEPHSTIFSADNRNVPTGETVFALYWKMGSYGDGSSYQAQMAPSSDWSPGSGWGSGKGLTYTLYNSYSDDDARKKEVCFFVGKGEGQGYTTVDGANAWYGNAYTAKKASGEVSFGQTGKDFLAQGQHLFNNIKKYIWGVNGTATHGSGMSIDRRQDIIRLSDVYMMRAEVHYLQANGTNVTAVSRDGSILKDINDVLLAHNAPTIDSIAYFTDYSSKHSNHEVFNFTVTVDDGQGGSTQEVVSVMPDQAMYHGEVRTDLMQQRRKEFAMEGTSWLDLKRLFYLNPEMAKEFMHQMDRGCTWTNSPEVEENSVALQNETGYKRLALVNKCNEQLKAKYGDKYSVGDAEVEIFTQTFLDNNRWYLPIPASAKAYLGGVEDCYDKVSNGNYSY